MEGAYRLGNHKFSKGDLPMFHDRREMTDAIQNAVNEAGMDCYYCSKNREED